MPLYKKLLEGLRSFTSAFANRTSWSQGVNEFDSKECPTSHMVFFYATCDSEESTSGLRLIAQRSGVRSPSLEVMILVGLLISTPASGTCMLESFSPKSLLVRSRKGALTGRISERTFSLDLDGEVQ